MSLRDNIDKVRTVVKFYKNPEALDKPDNEVITRTLLKIGVVDSRWKCEKSRELWPKDGELWKVEVVDEVHRGQAKGCFILVPIEKVDPESITPIVPGLYAETVDDSLLLLTPKDKSINWMLPIRLKRVIKHKNKAYAAIVCLD